MRIVIDMQGAQTESRFRGIGRYTLALTQAIARNRGDHEIILALSGLFPETIEPIRAAFAGLLPPQSIRVWHAPGPVKDSDPSNGWRREVAELIREAFLASLRPDIIHVTSLFEGYVDDAVSSIGRLDEVTPVSVSLYDLIPLLNPDQYLNPNPTYKACYERKVGHLSRAAVLLAISDFARKEGTQHLPVAPERVVNVSTAVDAQFIRKPVAEEDQASLRSQFAITRPFALYTGGSDERKNLPRLVQAYAALAPDLRSRHQLVFAGRMPEGDIESLRQLAVREGMARDELVFTGYVGDDELVALYNLCKLFVFPSWHEGFGLPALEAMSCGAPVIAANTSSLPEVVGLEEALFDPLDTVAIFRVLAHALTNDEYIQRLSAHGLRQATRFSWDATGKAAIRAWEHCFGSGDRAKSPEAATWPSMLEHRDEIYRHIVDKISSVTTAHAAVTDAQLAQLASAIESNERQADGFVRATELPPTITWRLEGPFDTSYSLALVNRESARALASLGHRVVLHSTEGPGDFPANTAFLAQNPDLAGMHRLAAKVSQSDSDVASRNLYPPRVRDMACRFNFLHGYAWEETGFPHEWAQDFNTSLQGIAVTSAHVRKVLVDNGVTVPIVVTGNGVDHWDGLEPDTDFRLQAKRFRFLHVSSCFPRKGADAMLRAYGDAFRAGDDVTLVIKTFTNPHNQIHDWLNAARAGDAEFPDVLILEEDFTDSRLKSLYGQCDALVAPSRAEGFGLPMAEAMLSGLPVITTAWSGQLDFCTDETAWLVDYRFERANSHIGLFDSVWAQPDVHDLARVMRQVFEIPEAQRNARIAAGQKLLREEFRWADVAHRMDAAARSWARAAEDPEPRIGWVTSWNTPCGIAAYSDHLIRSIPSDVKVLAASTTNLTGVDHSNVHRCWIADGHDSLEQLDRLICEKELDTVVIQFNYGFFDFDHLSNLIHRHVDAGRTIVAVMHATTDPAHAPEKKLSLLVPALSRCQRVLVHAPADLNRLKQHGLLGNVALLPHGIPDFKPPSDAWRRRGSDYVIASYGFFLPHKGLLELIEAIGLLSAQGLKIHLNMVNAQYPAPQSTQLIEQARARVSALGLEGAVSMCTEFLEDSDSMARLESSDLVVFPYQETGESSSAAVRSGLASGRPVAVTPLAIFDDVATAVHFLPGQSPQHLASGIADLLKKLRQGEGSVVQREASAERWRAAHQYAIVGQTLYGMLKVLHRENQVIRTPGTPSPAKANPSLMGTAGAMH